MKVSVHDRATGARIVLLEHAKPYKYCECCGNVGHYMYICDALVLCRDCAKNWKRLGLGKFLDTYWLPFDMPVIELECENGISTGKYWKCENCGTIFLVKQCICPCGGWVLELED